MYRDDIEMMFQCSLIGTSTTSKLPGPNQAKASLCLGCVRGCSGHLPSRGPSQESCGSEGPGVQGLGFRVSGSQGFQGCTPEVAFLKGFPNTALI